MFNNLLRLQYYTTYVPSGCDTEIGDHKCDVCADIEHGRVRSIAFIKKSFTFSDPTNPAQWLSAIAAKAVIIIPEVNGTFDGGSEQEGEGYGDQQTKLLGYNFTLTYKDPNYKTNAAFYNALKTSRNYYMAYKTETQIHMVLPSVQVIPKNPVTANTTDEVTWEVTVKWASGDLPIPYTAPDGIFTCFDYTT